jgi:N-acetylglucosaminyl-diphospho-decaprenol L-rhamnosyltransferase
MKRHTYQTSGGFDDAIFLFMEDVDLCDRINQMGLSVMYIPTAQVTHIGSESVSRFPIARIRNYHISPLYYFRKRGKANAVRILKTVFIVELAAKSVIRRTQNLLKPDPRRLEKARIEWAVIGDVWRY